MTTIKLKGIHKVRYQNKKTGKWYEYHRVGRGKGAKLFWKAGSNVPEGGVEYTAAYHAAIKGEKVSTGKFRDVLMAFLASPEFAKKAPRTQKDYKESIEHPNGLDKTFGDFPIAAMEDYRLLKKVTSWRDKKWGMTRQADRKVSDLKAILNWAVRNGHLKEHFIKNIEKVYVSDRSGIIWTDDEVKKFCQPPVPRYAQRILIAISETGLAPVDAVRLSRKHIKETPKGRRIEMHRSKTKIISSMPVTPLMAKVIDETPEGQDLILTTETGKPWKHQDQLGSLVSKWRDELGIRKELHLYDARGTAATRLLNAGMELHELALGMGWSIRTASKMIETYAQVNPEITDKMMEKIEAWMGEE